MPDFRESERVCQKIRHFDIVMYSKKAYNTIVNYAKIQSELEVIYDERQYEHRSGHHYDQPGSNRKICGFRSSGVFWNCRYGSSQHERRAGKASEKNESLTHGIQVEISDENSLTLDFHVIVAYGVNILSVYR